MSNPLDVVTRFVADNAGLDAGADKAKKAIGGIGPEALLMGAGVVAAAGLAVNALAGMVSAAAEDEAQQKKLTAAIEAAGAATADSNTQVEAAIAAGQARAFSDDQTREALMSLVTATGDVGAATAELAAAQDIARFAGVDLAAAADAVAKAHAGNDGALRKLIPGLVKGASATDTLAAAQAAAAGQADMFASSTEGSLAIASDSFGELGETIGSAFLPLLKAIIPPLTKLIAALGVLIEAVLPILTPAIEVLGAVLGAMIDTLVVVLDVVAKWYALLFSKLTPILKALSPVVDAVGSAIGGVVDWIRQLLDWIGKAIDAVGKFLDNLNPLKGFSLPSLPFSLAAPAGLAAGPSTRGAPAGRAASGTINIHVYGGDPRRVTAAVREGYRRWILTGGATAPDRDW